MAIPAGSLGCPNAEWAGTKALARRPLVNIRRDTIDIAPPKSCCLPLILFAAL